MNSSGSGLNAVSKIQAHNKNVPILQNSSMAEKIQRDFSST